MSAELKARLRAQFGADAVRDDQTALVAYGCDRSTQWQPRPSCVVFPQNVAQVQALVGLANQEGFAIVPSGGRTGLSGGAVANQGEVVLSLDRMNRILECNRVERSLRVEAGLVTQRVQEAAADAGLYYPVDFASSGSSQIGGNIATNAGGIKVIRYGMTREWVRGLKVVTGAGEVLDLNRGLIKNNTGYDLRHLFIGSEGTLGIIVEATLGLTTPPEDLGVMVLGVPRFEAILDILPRARERLALTAFEFFSQAGLAKIVQHTDLQAPFDTPAAHYVLIEYEQQQAAELAVQGLFEECAEAGWVVDGVVAQSGAEARRLWGLREDLSETLSRYQPYKNDIAVGVSQLPAFLAEAEALVARHYADFEVIWYGHIGDGNLHLNILRPEAMAAADFVRHCETVSAEMADLLRRFGGSVSAEHGVGLLKRDYLSATRSTEEIRLMQSMKAVFDPAGVLNPGKIFLP